MLSNLVDAGFMTEGQVYAARRNPATPVDQTVQTSPDWYLDFAYSRDEGGSRRRASSAHDRVLVVRTGLDSALQTKAETVVETSCATRRPPITPIRPPPSSPTPDGLVRAMVGGRDYGASQFNRATDAAAPAGLVVQDLRLHDRAADRQIPRRHADRRIGHLHRRLLRAQLSTAKAPAGMPLYRALAESLNTAAIRLSIKIGEAYWPPRQSYHLGKIADARPLQDRRRPPAPWA